MSDYISKSAASEMLMDIEWENGTLTAAILMLNDIPTLSETEIIRKAFERVVERLEEASFKDSSEVYNFWILDKDDAIKIVKEECGINE